MNLWPFSKKPKSQNAPVDALPSGVALSTPVSSSVSSSVSKSSLEASLAMIQESVSSLPGVSFAHPSELEATPSSPLMEAPPAIADLSPSVPDAATLSTPSIPLDADTPTAFEPQELPLSQDAPIQGVEMHLENPSSVVPVEDFSLNTLATPDLSMAPMDVKHPEETAPTVPTPALDLNTQDAYQWAPSTPQSLSLSQVVVPEPPPVNPETNATVEMLFHQESSPQQAADFWSSNPQEVATDSVVSDAFSVTPSASVGELSTPSLEAAWDSMSSLDNNTAGFPELPAASLSAQADSLTSSLHDALSQASEAFSSSPDPSIVASSDWQATEDFSTGGDDLAFSISATPVTGLDALAEAPVSFSLDEGSLTENAVTWDDTPSDFTVETLDSSMSGTPDMGFWDAPVIEQPPSATGGQSADVVKTGLSFEAAALEAQAPLTSELFSSSVGEESFPSWHTLEEASIPAREDTHWLSSTEQVTVLLSSHSETRVSPLWASEAASDDGSSVSDTAFLEDFTDGPGVFEFSSEETSESAEETASPPAKDVLGVVPAEGFGAESVIPLETAMPLHEGALWPQEASMSSGPTRWSHEPVVSAVEPNLSPDDAYELDAFALGVEEPVSFEQTGIRQDHETLQNSAKMPLLETDEMDSWVEEACFEDAELEAQDVSCAQTSKDWDSYDLGYYDDPEDSSQSFVLDEVEEEALPSLVNAVEHALENASPPVQDLKPVASMTSQPVSNTSLLALPDVPLPVSASPVIPSLGTQTPEPSPMPPVVERRRQPRLAADGTTKLYSQSMADALDEFEQDVILQEARFMKRSIDNLVDRYFANRDAEGAW